MSHEVPDQGFATPCTGTFKFTYDGARVQPGDTPGGVSFHPPRFLLPLIFLQLGMEDGDQIDAFLEQVSLDCLLPAS